MDFDKYIDYLLENDKYLLTELIHIGEEYLGDFSIYDYLINERDLCPVCFSELKSINDKQLITEGIYESINAGYKCTNSCCAFVLINT